MRSNAWLVFAAAPLRRRESSLSSPFVSSGSGGGGGDPGPGGSRMTSKSSTESVTRSQFHARSILDMQAVRRNNDVRP